MVVIVGELPLLEALRRIDHPVAKIIVNTHEGLKYLYQEGLGHKQRHIRDKSSEIEEYIRQSEEIGVPLLDTDTLVRVLDAIRNHDEYKRYLHGIAMVSARVSSMGRSIDTLDKATRSAIERMHRDQVLTTESMVRSLSSGKLSELTQKGLESIKDELHASDYEGLNKALSSAERVDQIPLYLSGAGFVKMTYILASFLARSHHKILRLIEDELKRRSKPDQPF